MSTYATSRGTLLEAVHATINAFANSCGSQCNTLLLGEDCRTDLAAAAEKCRFQRHETEYPGMLMGLRIKWVPGREVAVGNFVSLQ